MPLHKLPPTKCCVMGLLLLCRHARAFRGTFVRSLGSRYQDLEHTVPFCYHDSRFGSLQPRLALSPSRSFVLSASSSDIESPFIAEIDPFNECWKSNSWSVNPLNDTAIDQILQALHSPAPQSFYVVQRALALAQEEASSASSTTTSTTESIHATLETCAYLIKPGYQFVMRPSNDGLIEMPGKDWNVTSTTTVPATGWTAVTTKPAYNSTLQIANEALALVTAASQAQVPVDDAQIDRLVDLCEQRLRTTLGTDIRGRTAADAAFTLALAGVTRESLYLSLVKIAKLEFLRVGRRPSRRAKDILQAIEKLAAAGLRGAEVEEVFQIAAECLAAKTEKKYMDVMGTLLATPSEFNLLSPRPLLWLWRFSARQTKARNETATEETDVDANISSVRKTASKSWLQGYNDTSRPLIVDIGCGLGVSMLGLASLESAGRGTEASDLLGTGVAFADCNYLGGDLSRLALRFGEGIASRWDLSDRLQFTCASAEDLLDEIHLTYPGPVALVLIQFPTPYRLLVKEGGNTQLPSDRRSGFMASKRVMQQTAKLLQKVGGGRLLLQSNCEDVAVTMRDIAKESGMRCIQSTQPVTSLDNFERLPQRTQEWIRLGGERAIGPEWSFISPLPTRCATETEVSCELQDTPVHRCVMEVGLS